MKVTGQARPSLANLTTEGHTDFKFNIVNSTMEGFFLLLLFCSQVYSSGFVKTGAEKSGPREGLANRKFAQSISSEEVTGDECVCVCVYV